MFFFNDFHIKLSQFTSKRMIVSLNCSAKTLIFELQYLYFFLPQKNNVAILQRVIENAFSQGYKRVIICPVF